jgi:Cof subfamily protein (haloacid dehalogenase superfamily)
MKDVKIVFTDIDSTLTYAPGKIDIKNKKIFENLKNIGIPVVISTGRSIPYAVSICKQFSTSSYVIASNGAEVYNYVSKNMIYRSVINPENIAKLDEMIEKYNLMFIANGVERRYSNKLEDSTGLVPVTKLSKITNEEISQVVVQSYNKEDMMYFRKELLETTSLKIGNKTKHISDNKLLYYDIVNNDVSKGNALEILCKHLNIKCERAMAIGDSDNDIEMLEKAGYKVAVANASEKLKEVANLLTLSNKENGVAIILSELYSKLNE